MSEYQWTVLEWHCAECGERGACEYLDFRPALGVVDADSHADAIAADHRDRCPLCHAKHGIAAVKELGGAL